MDSKNTKATPAPSTKRPSPTRGPRSGTAAASLASKNSSNRSNFQFGLQLELQVLEHLRQKFKANLIQHRYRSPFGEVDLLMRLPSGELLMVEVKSLVSEDRKLGRLTAQQQRRLQRVFLWLCESHVNVLFWLIFVDPKGRIQIEANVFG